MQEREAEQATTAAEFRRERREQPDRKYDRDETGGESGSGHTNAGEHSPRDKELHSEGPQAAAERRPQHLKSQVDFILSIVVKYPAQDDDERTLKKKKKETLALVREQFPKLSNLAGLTKLDHEKFSPDWGCSSRDRCHVSF